MTRTFCAFDDEGPFRATSSEPVNAAHVVANLVNEKIGGPGMYAPSRMRNVRVPTNKYASPSYCPVPG